MARPGALIEVMQNLAVLAVEVLGVAGATVVLPDAEGRLRPAAATDAPGAGLVTTELSLGEGPTMDALHEGAVVVADDLAAQSGRWPEYSRRARSAGVGAVAVFPFAAGEHAGGALTVVATEPRQWHVTDVAAAEVLVDLASGYAAHESELGRIRRTADQLQEALESRVDIEQAKGVLVGELGCTVDQAYVMLRNHARRNSVSLRSVAQAVVHLGLRPPLPGRRRQGPGTAPAPRPAEHQPGGS